MAPSADEIALAISTIGAAHLAPKDFEVQKWLRISDVRFKDGLGFNPLGSSRFSDPRPSPQFGVVYLAQDLATAVAEAIVRDRKDAHPGILKMTYQEAIGRWQVFEISTSAPLQLLNLSGMGLMLHGVPTDIVRQADHTNSQQLSLAIHGNAAAFDGIHYQSRFFGECVAVYDRSLHKMSVIRSALLESLEGSLAPIFKQMGIEIIR